MLKRVEIDNFLTIEHISLDLDSNFIAIIGESGAGKSLVLKAIDTVFSQKTPTNIIGRFSKESVIKLFFSLNKEQSDYLFEFGITDEEILIEKLIKPKKTRAFVNHEPISAKTLSDIKDKLINIVSQNYRFRFLEEDNIINIIDRVVDKNIKNDFEKAYDDFKKIERKKEEIEKEIAVINEKHPEVLLESIEKVSPKKGEYENLLNRLKQTKAISFVKEKSYEIIDKLYENDNSVETVLTEISGLFEKINDMGFDVQPVILSLNDMLDNLSNIKNTIYGLQNELPKENVDDMESRLFELEQLQRKFHKTVDEIVQEKNILTDMINKKELLEIKLEDTKKVLDKKSEILKKKAQLLSAQRKNAAEDIQKTISGFLKKMLLENSVVEFVFSSKNIDKTGQDMVNILFSANPDIKADKMDKTASGGEMSRFILSVEAANSTIKKTLETIILDEIETGISDKTLQKTAQVIEELSKKNQIILITHNRYLSQLANRVFKMEKEFDGNITRSFAKKIK